MVAVQPKRHYQKYKSSDVVSDIVETSDGKTHFVSMRGWHWNHLSNVEKKCRNITQGLIDHAFFCTFLPQNHTLSQTLEAAIYYFVEDVIARRQNKKKESDVDEKDTVGSA